MTAFLADALRTADFFAADFALRVTTVFSATAFLEVLIFIFLFPFLFLSANMPFGGERANSIAYFRKKSMGKVKVFLV